MRCSKKRPRFDHLVGAGERRRRHFEVERPGPLGFDRTWRGANNLNLTLFAHYLLGGCLTIMLNPKIWAQAAEGDGISSDRVATTG
jgi:hypothetical protein